MDKRGMGYLVIGSNAGKQQCWLKLTLANRWTAAYRLTYHGQGPQRRARIGELRIVPGRSASFDPKRDYELWESRERASWRPLAPFSFDAIRRGVTARRFADAVAAIVSILPDDEAPDSWGNPASRVSTSSSPPRRAVGRPARPAAFYAKFAVQYDRVENNDRRELGASTRAVLARQRKVPVTTIGKWIRTARQQGFLTPVDRGQRGGMATTRALELSSREKTRISESAAPDERAEPNQLQQKGRRHGKTTRTRRR